MRWMLAAVAAMGLAGGAMAQQAATASPPPELGMSPQFYPAAARSALRIGDDLGLLHAAARVCPGNSQIAAANQVLIPALRARLAAEAPDQRWQDVAAGVAMLAERTHSLRSGMEHCALLHSLVGRVALEHLAR